MHLREKLLITLVLSLTSASFAETERVIAEPLTLERSYRLALQQNENLRIQQEGVTLSKAKARSAVGGALPDLRWTLTDQIQDTSSNANVNPGFFEKERIESKFTLRQPLFAGNRQFSAWRGYLKQSERDHLLLKKASVNLYKNVAEAFYNVIATETDLKNNQTSIQLAEDRLKDLRQRAGLGKTRDSEVLSADSQLQNLKAEKAAIEGQIISQRVALSFYVGQSVEKTPILDELSVATSTLSLDQYMKLSQKRSDIDAQSKDLEAHQYVVRYRKGFHSPSVDFLGNYYTKRSSFYKGIDWDILLTLDVPLYQGGIISADTDQAVSEYRQSKLALDLLNRQVQMEVQQAYTNLQTSIAQVDAYERAYIAAKRSYELQVKEYRYGLVNNLEVLQALNVMQADKKAWDDAIIRNKFYLINLNVVTENIPSH